MGGKGERPFCERLMGGSTERPGILGGIGRGGMEFSAGDVGVSLLRLIVWNELCFFYAQQWRRKKKGEKKKDIYN
jgi:hypothetical protein